MLEGCDRDHEDHREAVQAVWDEIANALGPIVKVLALTVNRPDAADRRCERPAMALTGVK